TTTGRYIDKLVEYLSKLKPGYDVIVLAKTHRVDYLQHLAPNFTVVKSDYKEFSFGEQLGLWRQLRGLKPDLVHFGMTQQPVLYRGRAVTTIHDLTTIRFNNPAKFWPVFKFKQQIYKLVIKRVAKKSQYVITPSLFVKNDVARYTKVNPNKIVVTYEAADRISSAPKVVPRLKDKQFIMYVGRSLPHKNLERLVQAYGLIRSRHPGLMLVLVGKTDSNYRRIEALVSDKRMADSVVFTDFISEGELRWLYENTSAYVFPSLSEGFGLPPLEAMMHGAPVLSSNATCLPEINGKAAVYFNPRSINDMARKIDKVLADKVLRDAMASRGRAQAVKYSWRRMAQQTLKIYDQALNKNT
ncbi:MAG TPA: glycosyltransferase family 1 protein, partial [Candidatus Saccharimonadales bacterium]|nr:glycosyltransferase family 1 protein [Candidatus Saccharimonadales bacterium]